MFTFCAYASMTLKPFARVCWGLVDVYKFIGVQKYVAKINQPLRTGLFR